MDDYISRRAAIDLLKKWSDGYSYIEVETNSAIKAFEEIPSADTTMDEIHDLPSNDAAPVVRCNDCKWYQMVADKWCGYFECMGFEPDDYCSQGERKEDGDHDD